MNASNAAAGDDVVAVDADDADGDGRVTATTMTTTAKTSRCGC